MSSFAEQLAVGADHERRVAAESEARGWTVTPWGQSMLPAVTRRAMRDTRFQHFPDIVAARPGEIVTIDAKDSMPSTETGRYAVSQKCVQFGLQFFAAFGLPVFYVFSNLGVLCPTEVTSYGRLGPPSSGGAYYLVDGRYAHLFDDVFGRPAGSMAA
jgi:hypothetical protein